MRTVEFEHLSKRYGAVEAVRDVTFRAAPGRVTGLLGGNGAGKTTSLRVLLGLTRPTTGSATIGGTPITGLDRPAEVVGAVLDADTLHPGVRARDHLRILASAGGVDPERVEEVLGMVGMVEYASRRMGGFSTGMRGRIALAGALLGDPEVLVLDEPTNGLDPAGIHWLRGLLRGLAGEGRTVVLSSHHLNEVARTVDDVVIIDRGAVLDQGPLCEFGDGLEDQFLSLTAVPGGDR